MILDFLTGAKAPDLCYTVSTLYFSLPVDVSASVGFFVFKINNPNLYTLRIHLTE